MKNIKTYEEHTDKSIKDKPNFDVGDTVICKEQHIKHLQKNEKYIVEELIMAPSGAWYCKLKGIDKEVFFCKRFISELEYNSKKYNI